jgi:parallel beta-helix repeat protein
MEKTRSVLVLFGFFALFAAFPSVVSAFPITGLPVNVRDFGAKGDGSTLDTSSINTAIATVAAAGGGTLEFPAGTYLSTSIRLKSNITLLLDQGATIDAAPYSATAAYDPPEDNPAAGVYEDYGHRHFQNSLIWGDGLENVTIEGAGKIWGQGLVRGDDHPEYSGNKSICLKLCRNVTLRDFSILHGGWFAILATGDENVTIDNLKIDTNRDGMDIDSCRNVRVSNCTVNSPNDDGICLKSSYGLGYAKATQDVTITNCCVSGYDEGSVLNGTYTLNEKTAHQGRIKFGTESNGGFINIAISNCVFDDCEGLALEEVDGGILENISVTNITMRNPVNAPIFVRLGGRMRAPAGSQYSIVRHINLSNFVVENADPANGCIISGVPGHDIEDLNLENINIWYRGGGTTADAARIPGEQVTGYPDPGFFGTMPSYGMYLRHINGVSLDNVHLRTLTPDARPEYVLSDVSALIASNSEGLPVQP